MAYSIMKNLVKLIVYLCVYLMVVYSKAQTGITSWPTITQEAKPWTRWWWMGNAVDEPNLRWSLSEYAKVGLGGVEITPIYGAKGYENQYIDFLSEKWLEKVDFTTQTAQQFGMGVDLNLGTGWPFGGPQITPQNASSKLFLQQYQLKEGAYLQDKITVLQLSKQKYETSLQALTAYSKDGMIQIITDQVNAEGKLQWQAPKGDWTLYALFLGKTGQKVKRAAPAGEGWVMDHFSGIALKQYLNRFNDAFGQKLPAIRAFFNDSYEVYDANFTPDFIAEFQQRRGYDLRYYLREVFSEENDEKTARIKADFRATLSDLLLEKFMKPWVRWAHQHQKIIKNQAHGSPANILDLYAQADIPECETFGSSYFAITGLRRDTADIRKVHPEPLMPKFATSAAHVSGKKWVSSEAFTWLTEHFKTSLAQCKPEAEQLFLAGANHIFFHGTTYSPQNILWPGWMFYAGVNFSPNNTFWPHLSGLTHYIARCQAILQDGQPDNELLVYWPIHDIWHKKSDLLQQIRVHEVNDWLYPEAFYRVVSLLHKQGYATDFISDKLLQNAVVKNGQIITSNFGNTYKAIVVPSTQKMPIETFMQLIDLANRGATVIFEDLPQSVPGFGHWLERENQLKNLDKGQITITKQIVEVLTRKRIEAETLVETGLQFIRRRNKKGVVYYLVNHTSNTIEGNIPLNSCSVLVSILDPQTGNIGKAKSYFSQNKTFVKLKLRSGESLFLQTYSKNQPIPAWSYDEEQKPIQIQGKWTIDFREGGPILPQKIQIDTLKLWTDLSDEAMQNYSGAGGYSIYFELNKTAKDYYLDLGKLAESAEVFVNKKSAGIVWSVPSRLKIGYLLKNGRNFLQIEVRNLMANRIRYMDKNKEIWRNYHEINFVNAHYQPFDASNWRIMDAGLAGPVTLIPCK